MPENTSNGVAIGSLERAEGELEGIDRARVGPGAVPDPELVERPRRRRFSAQYKLEILREADACTRPGEIGELLEVVRIVVELRDGDPLNELSQTAETATSGAGVEGVV